MLTAVLLLTLGVCAVAYALGWALGRRAGWIAAAGLLVGAGVLVRAWQGRGAADSVTEVWPWLPSFDVALRLRLDGLSFAFGLIVLIIGAIVVAYSAGYLPRGRHGPFLGLLTFFAVAMMGLILADDLIVLWIMWEFTTICSFLLITQVGPKGKDPGIRTFLVTAAGGLALLGAVCLIRVEFGTTDLHAVLHHPGWAANPGFSALIAVLVAIAAFTKSAQFPFHSWLPDAMVASTPVSAYLHAAAMVKAGIYLALRFSPALAEVPVWNALLITIGLTTALMGALFALQRHDLKELLAYSTVSQLGFLVATIGIGSAYALIGAIVHVLAHATFKSALFMSVGVIDHQCGSRDIRVLNGLHRTMPITSALLTVSAASMAGIPLFFGFVSKEAMFKAMSQLPGPAVFVVATAAVLAASLTFAYSARMVIGVITSAHGRRMADPPGEGGADLLLPVAVVALAGIVLGVAGPIAEPVVNAAAAAVATEPPAADLALWHGLTPALGMTAIVLLTGAVLVVARARIDGLLDRQLIGFRAVDVVEAFRSTAIRFGARTGDVTRSDSPFRHLIPPLVGVAAIGAFGLAFVQMPAPRPGLNQPLDWLLLPVVAVGAALALVARSRIALVTTVGVAGFAVSLWFFVLGAPDVALTQLLVEILTVVVMVLLLSRLPRTFHPSGRPRLIFAAIMGLAVGGTAALSAYALTGRREISAAGAAMLDRAQELTGGTNVVNVILVDFRALDTLGEAIVLGVTGVALIAALDARGLLPLRTNPIVVERSSAIHNPRANAVTLRVSERLLGPVLVVLSVFFYLRGHNAPGGGFIAALIGAAALALIYVAASSNRIGRLRLPYVLFIAAGTVIGVGTGLVGFVEGSFLTPLHAYAGPVHLTTALIFDLGVYLNVIGVVLAAISKLGVDEAAAPPLRFPEPARTRREESR
ncbi:MAG: DUF4040 family protein [Propionibacteriaceae bacterium]|nr:DUF4040 family protein [Propionibacteriaceae bacterium]